MECRDDTFVFFIRIKMQGIKESEDHVRLTVFTHSFYFKSKIS